jgi:hypothetical protein
VKSPFKKWNPHIQMKPENTLIYLPLNGDDFEQTPMLTPLVVSHSSALTQKPMSSYSFLHKRRFSCVEFHPDANDETVFGGISSENFGEQQKTKRQVL